MKKEPQMMQDVDDPLGELLGKGGLGKYVDLVDENKRYKDALEHIRDHADGKWPPPCDPVAIARRALQPPPSTDKPEEL